MEWIVFEAGIHGFVAHGDVSGSIVLSAIEQRSRYLRSTLDI